MFGLCLVVTLGKIKFWIFPNLDNEKLGFVDSFKPFYSLEHKDAAKDAKGKKKKKKDKGTSEKPSGDSEQGAKDGGAQENEELVDEEKEKLEQESERDGEDVGVIQTEQIAS